MGILVLSSRKTFQLVTVVLRGLTCCAAHPQPVWDCNVCLTAPSISSLYLGFCWPGCLHRSSHASPACWSIRKSGRRVVLATLLNNATFLWILHSFFFLNRRLSLKDNGTSASPSLHGSRSGTKNKHSLGLKPKQQGGFQRFENYRNISF